MQKNNILPLVDAAAVFCAVVVIVVEIFTRYGAFAHVFGISSSTLLLIFCGYWVVRLNFFQKIVNPSYRALFFLLLIIFFLIGGYFGIQDASNFTNYVLSEYGIDFRPATLGFYTFSVVFLLQMLTMRTQKDAVKRTMFYLPALLSAGAYLLWLWPFGVFIKALTERGIIEWLQFGLLMLAASIAIGSSAVLFQKRKWLLFIVTVVTSLGFLFLAGEEISWGQHILNFETPEYFTQTNLQNEVTLHNSEQVAGYIWAAYVAVCLWGILSSFVGRYVKLWWMQLFTTDKLSVLYYLFPLLYLLQQQYYGHIDESIKQWSEFTELILILGFVVFAHRQYVAVTQRTESQ